MKGEKLKVFLKLMVLAAVVVGLSMLSGRMWGGEKKKEAPREIVITEEMTAGQIATKYNIERPMLKKAFGLKDKSDLMKSVGQLGMTGKQAEEKLRKVMAFKAEEGSKNWKKIAAKFFLWIVFLGFVFSMLRKKRITVKNRTAILFAAVLIFGVALGSDPNPMGTIKDAIVLWGKQKIIFPPRMIALAVFLFMVIAANKFICSWGCQFGTLQELAFRLNRNKKDNGGIIRQYKIPFVVTNTIRATFFAAIIVAALAWLFDIVKPIDPFNIFTPAHLGIIGGAFVALVLAASVFVYRPWCTMLCPFGFVGWVFEKLSVNKIKVDYNTCIGCKACAKACPSTVMEAILVQDRTIPDCFSCGTCMNVCPTGSIGFKSGSRDKPPAGKFDSASK